MSVNWSWKGKKGEITFNNARNGKNFKVNIYLANCLGALIYEYKDKETKKNMYRFYGYWNDIQHLKNILGLSKEYKDNLYKNEDIGIIIKKIKLNTYYDDWHKIAKIFTISNVKVELYYKDMNKNKK